MEEFERINIVADFYDRAVERECVVDNLFQCLCLHVLAEESVCYAIGNFLETEFFDVVEEFLR